MKTIEYKKDYIESCVLIAVVDGENYRFKVAPKEIETSIEFIQTAYTYFNRDCNKIYISGFTLETSGSNLSKEEILKRIANQVKRKRIEPKEIKAIMK